VVHLGPKPRFEY
jgi:hypothetical protein